MGVERATAEVEQRNFFRVRCRLPIRLTRVREDRIDALEWEILHREEDADFGSIDPQLARWLDRIEGKLDDVLLHLGVIEQSLRPSDVLDMVLSGSGVRLHWREALEPESVVMMELELPGAPARTVRCLCSVIACEPGEGGDADVALTFRSIHERDRQAIVQHTLAVKRDELRSRSDDRSSS